jgi:hypothetical protein
MPPKISIEQYEFFLSNNIPYTGYVIGLGYADLASGCILPETFGMFNPPGRTKSYNDSFCQSFFVPTVDISPYMYAKSLDISVEDITSIITKANADSIQVYLGNGKSVSVPRNDSNIDVKLVDDGANIHIEIKANTSSWVTPNFGRITLLDFLEECSNGSVDAAMNQKTLGQETSVKPGENQNPSEQGGNSTLYDNLTTADFINSIPVGYSLWGVENSFLSFSTQTLKYGQRINAKVFSAAELTAHYQGMMSGLAKGANLLGKGSFFLGGAISTAQFALQPSYMNGMMAAADIAYGYVGTYGGPPGWIAAGYYNAVKYTIGWENIANASCQMSLDIDKQTQTQPIFLWHIPGPFKR